MYPAELLPQPDYNIIPPENIRSISLIRTTAVDIYKLVQEQNVQYDECLDDIVGQGTDKKDIFVFSLLLFCDSTEHNIGIRETEGLSYQEWVPGMLPAKIGDIQFEERNLFPLYLNADKLYNKDVTFEGTKYTLSYEHKPNIVNYWHFQIFTDENSFRLKRECKAGKYKRLARHLLENILVKAICTKKEAVKYPA